MKNRFCMWVCVTSKRQNIRENNFVTLFTYMKSEKKTSFYKLKFSEGSISN